MHTFKFYSIQQTYNGRQLAFYWFYIGGKKCIVDNSGPNSQNREDIIINPESDKVNVKLQKVWTSVMPDNIQIVIAWISI